MSKVVFIAARGIHKWEGLSSETKPTDLVQGSEAYETDTSNVYGLFGGSWYLIKTSGVAHNRLVASEVADAFQRWIKTGDLTEAIVASGTIVYPSPDISAHNLFVLEVQTISGTTPALKAQPSIDGTNFAANHLAWIDMESGATIAGNTGITAAGIYALRLPSGGGIKVQNFKLVLSGGAADLNLTARGAHGVG